MQVTGPAAPCTNRKVTCQMSFSARRKGCYFLVPDMNPLDLALPANRVRQTIEAVSNDSVDPLDTRGGERLRKLVGYCLCHEVYSSLWNFLNSVCSIVYTQAPRFSAEHDARCLPCVDNVSRGCTPMTKLHGA